MRLFAFLMPSLLITLFLGFVLGITSQHLPEIKAYTDTIIQPVERNELIKKWKGKIAVALSNGKIQLAEQHVSIPFRYTQENPLPEHPVSSFIVHRPAYSLAYDARNRNPLWVYERLTNENIKDKTHLPHFDFKEDENIPQHLRATLADYHGQGIDQGFMAAPSHASNPETLNDAYYLSNICPQCHQLNQSYWKKLEEHVRNLAKNYATLHVISGPLYMPYYERGGRFVKYRVIGPNDVGVPSHFFKVLILEDGQGRKEMVAYILPNHEVSPHTPLETFRTTVKNVEKAAGILITNPDSS